MMVTPTRPQNKRPTTPYQYLDAAAADCVSGNLESSSENMWKASALAVAAVAKSHDWPHATDSDLEEVITRLERANGDDLALWGKWVVATILRDNANQNVLEPVEVRAARPTILQLVGKLLAEAERQDP